jgi:hypothetical protein
MSGEQREVSSDREIGYENQLFSDLPRAVPKLSVHRQRVLSAGADRHLNPIFLRQQNGGDPWTGFTDGHLPQSPTQNGVPDIIVLPECG